MKRTKTTVIMRNPMSDCFQLDPDHGIIASGPVVTIDCGMLRPMFIRAVIVCREFATPRYRTAIERVTHDGNHDGYDPSGTTHESYGEAVAAFADLVKILPSMGRPYHDIG